MNLKGGIALIKKSFFSYTATRGFFWTLTLSWMMMPLIYMFVWFAAAGNDSIGGFTKGDFAGYYIILIIVNQLTYPVSHWTVGDTIFSGQFSGWLLRPLPPIYEGIAADIAVKVICLPFVCVFAFILILIFKVTITVTMEQIGLFMLCLAMAQVLRFMLAYSLSLLALMKTKIDSLLAINDAMILLFAGQLVPTVLLPEIIRIASFILPYRYMLGFPIEILLGKLEGSQILFGIGLQVLWIMLVFVLHQVIWKIGIKHYSSVGG